jgi:hypothetical protein
VKQNKFSNYIYLIYSELVIENALIQKQHLIHFFQMDNGNYHCDKKFTLLEFDFLDYYSFLYNNIYFYLFLFIFM